MHDIFLHGTQVLAWQQLCEFGERINIIIYFSLSHLVKIPHLFSPLDLSASRHKTDRLQDWVKETLLHCHELSENGRVELVQVVCPYSILFCASRIYEFMVECILVYKLVAVLFLRVAWHISDHSEDLFGHCQVREEFPHRLPMDFLADRFLNSCKQL
jgi:hypothetical protein